MFQTSSEILSVMWSFVATGFFYGIFCDAVRFIRIALGGGKTALFVADLILSVLSAPILILASIEYGEGIMRMYYILSFSAGLWTYFLTIGFLTRHLAILAGKIVYHIKNMIKKLIYNPIVKLFGSIQQKMLNKFAQLHQKTAKSKENLQLSLKKHTAMLYNNKIGKLCTNGGEEKNVIKAKVRKKA